MPKIATTSYEYLEPELMMEHRGIKLWHTYRRGTAVKTGAVSLFKEPVCPQHYPYQWMHFHWGGYRSWSRWDKSYADGSANHKDTSISYQNRYWVDDGVKYSSHTIPAIKMGAPYSSLNNYELVKMPRIMKRLGLYPRNWHEYSTDPALSKLCTLASYADFIDQLLANNVDGERWRRIFHYNEVIKYQYAKEWEPDPFKEHLVISV